MAGPEVPASDESDDLGADIGAAYDSLVGDSQDSPDASAPAAPASAPISSASTPPPSEVAGADSRARGPDGKFVKGQAAAPAAPIATAPGTAPVAAPDFKIPEKWPAHVRAKLTEIHAANPGYAQFLLDEYGSMRAISAQHYQKSQEHLKAYESLLAPGRQARALKGVDDSTYVRNLIAAGDFMDKNPIEGIKYLAKTYGVDQQIQFPDARAGGEPEIPAYVQELRSETQQIKQFIQSQVQGVEQQQMQAASKWVNDFAEQRDANGQPLYPYFDRVLDELLVNVQYQRDHGQPIDVKAAYERAIRMNDSVWIDYQRAGSAAAEKAAAAQRLRDIEDAKRAGISVSGSGADTRGEVPDDIGKHLEGNYDKLFS